MVKKHMIKLFKLLTVILAVSFVHLHPVSAQSLSDYGESKKPKPTSADNIAMMFYKMSGVMPDFEKIAEKSEAYKNAAIEDKLYVRDARAGELKNIYRLLAAQDAVIIETPVKLSDYSSANKGFFVEDFAEDTFFPVEGSDRNYAIVPIGLMDRQWLRSPDLETSKTIQAYNKASEGKNLSMVLYLSSKYTDNSAPVKIDDKDYWLMGVAVDKMMIYLPGSSIPIWQSDNIGEGSDNAKLRELLNLRQ